MSDVICIGDKVTKSPVGPGILTSITDAGYPRVNEVAVVWLVTEDGTVYNPYNKEIPDE